MESDTHTKESEPNYTHVHAQCLKARQRCIDILLVKKHLKEEPVLEFFATVTFQPLCLLALTINYGLQTTLFKNKIYIVKNK